MESLNSSRVGASGWQFPSEDYFSGFCTQNFLVGHGESPRVRRDGHARCQEARTLVRVTLEPDGRQWLVYTFKDRQVRG